MDNNQGQRSKEWTRHIIQAYAINAHDPLRPDYHKPKQIQWC